jgi:hypothetical protein
MNFLAGSFGSGFFQDIQKIILSNKQGNQRGK